MDWKIGACLISGVSSGIGKATAEKLLLEGGQVLGYSRTPPEISHSNFSFFPCDVLNTKELETFLKKIKKENITSLVLNCGVGLFGHLEELSIKEAKDLFEVNFFSHMSAVKELLPEFKKRGKGHIIAIGSESALAAKRKGSLYSASKFALRGFIEAMRDELESSGIKVTMIHPGMVETPFFDDLFFKPGEDESEHLKAKDVAEAVFYALSSRPGCVIDNIALSPQKKKVLFKKNQ